MNRNGSNHSGAIREETLRSILGISQPVPLTPQSMAESLRVTFFPISSASDRVRSFSARLRRALLECGVTIVEYEEALVPGTSKLKEGIVVVAPGELETGNLPVDHVTNLRSTTVVGVLDGPCPADLETGLQEKLNSIVKALAWSIVNNLIFVDDTSWTVFTMNGAIIKCSSDGSFTKEVFDTLVPKLAAPVVPPHSSDFEVREGVLDLSSSTCAPYVRDFVESGDLWARTGLLLFHTSLDSLEFRNRYYKRIAAAYLDHRSGMSYGFLARQLPSHVKPAFSAAEANSLIGKVDLNGNSLIESEEATYALLNINGEMLVAEVPDIWMLTTRSGCDKSNIDTTRDLLLMGLKRGKVVFETPDGVSTKIDCKPSYDTMTILSHAVGNALATSVLLRANPKSRFATTFIRRGMALAHWHGYVDPNLLPQEYIVHGETNPPVSCSTHQAAIYALSGKMSAVERSLADGIEFAGDVHVEPHHGTNMTGPSLLWLAEWVLENIGSIEETQANSATSADRVAAFGR